MLERLERWCFSLRPAVFFGAVLLFVFLRNGLWVYPGIETMRALAETPTRNPIPNDLQSQYVVWSWLGPAVAHVLGLGRTKLGIAGLNLGVFVAGLGVLFVGLRRRFDDQTARIALLLLACLPVTSVVAMWLGDADAFTFALLSLVLLNQSTPVGLLIGALIGANHFEQGEVAIAALLVVRREARSALLATLVGGVIGRGALMLYFHHVGMELQSSRLSVMVGRGLVTAAAAGIKQLQPLVFSLFQAGWIAIVSMALALGRSNPKEVRIWLLTGVGLFGVTMLGADSTRVFANLSWPVAIALLLRIRAASGRRGVLLSLIGAAVVPPIIVWQGHIFSTMLYYTLTKGSDVLLHTSFLARHQAYWMDLPYR